MNNIKQSNHHDYRKPYTQATKLHQKQKSQEQRSVANFHGKRVGKCGKKSPGDTSTKLEDFVSGKYSELPIHEPITPIMTPISEPQKTSRQEKVKSNDRYSFNLSWSFSKKATFFFLLSLIASAAGQTIMPDVISERSLQAPLPSYSREGIAQNSSLAHACEIPHPSPSTFEDDRLTFGFGRAHPEGIPINPLSSVDTVRKEALRVSHPKEIKPYTLDSSFKKGNAILVTQDAEETTEWRYELIRNAKKSFECSGNFGGGNVFLRTMDEIDRAMAKNPELKVNLIFSATMLKDQQLAAISRLKETYKDRFNLLVTSVHWPSLGTTVENHVKVSIMDGEVAIIGGTGISDNFCQKGDRPPVPDSTKSWDEVLVEGTRDNDIIIKGSTARTLRSEFFLLDQAMRKLEGQPEAPVRWFPVEGELGQVEKLNTHPRLRRNRQIKAIACGPEQVHNTCTQEVVDLIKRSDKLYIAHMYQNFIPEIEDSLNTKAKAGVPIKVITNGIGGNSPLMSSLMVLTFEDLDGPAVKTYYYDVPKILYHKKEVVSYGSDGVVCSNIGSYNLGKKSDYSDYEIMVTVCEEQDDQSVAKDIVSILEKDISLSRSRDDDSWNIKLTRLFFQSMKGFTEQLGHLTV